MSDEWRIAAQTLTDDQRKIALTNLLTVLGDVECGIIRQILGKDQKPLTEAQKYIYEKNIEPCLVERCDTCNKFIPAGTNRCSICKIEYGEE